MPKHRQVDTQTCRSNLPPWVIAALLLVAACCSRAGEFEFVVIGDTRPTFESENFQRFESVIPKINALKPALVINLGDLIYGYGLLRKERQWDKYERVIQAIEPPYYQLPGNHDTYSKEARRIYGQRFGEFYQSFNYADCHFVLLDNTEHGRSGLLAPEELTWLRQDLQKNVAAQVFVFLHYPVWDPERVTPRSHEFWVDTLHPLFRGSRVKAVFGGHYHSYGPTREFDGIRYFITGGGGAELRPEYKKSGGQFHFMRVRVSGGSFDVRVVTEHGEMSDSEADVMGGLLFGDRNSSRIGILEGKKDLKAGVEFFVSLHNPDKDYLQGKATWEFDESSFSVEPRNWSILVSPGATQQATFTLRALKDIAALQSLPRLAFDVTSGRRHHRFHRDVRFVQEVPSVYHPETPVLDGVVRDWGPTANLSFGEGARSDAEVRSFHNAENLYLAVTIPDVKPDEDDELTDELQMGLARRLSETDFGNDFVRLGFNAANDDARNRTPGRKKNSTVPGVRSVCHAEAGRKTFEIAIPLRLLKHQVSREDPRLVLNLSYQLPDPPVNAPEPTQLEQNSFSYNVRYGSDSLFPLHFVDLRLEKWKPAKAKRQPRPERPL